MSEYGPCSNCGANSEEVLVPVWEDVETYRITYPDYVGCVECNTMRDYGE